MTILIKCWWSYLIASFFLATRKQRRNEKNQKDEKNDQREEGKFKQTC